MIANIKDARLILIELLANKKDGFKITRNKLEKMEQIASGSSLKKINEVIQQITNIQPGQKITKIETTKKQLKTCKIFMKEELIKKTKKNDEHVFYK